MGFAYQDPFKHQFSRDQVFIGDTIGNIYDVLYDMGCSTTVAFALGCYDATAHRVLALGDGELVLYGDSLQLCACSWSMFNGRYRTWERFVKYARQLKASESAEAGRILGAAKQCLVFVGADIEGDVASTWSKTWTPGAKDRLVEWKLDTYTPPLAPEIFKILGVTLPKLCGHCEEPFGAVLANTDDEIHAIPGLPIIVISSSAIGLAAAIRRAAILVTSAECCDTCACRIGAWGDNAPYKVLLALMKSEPELSSKEWLLQNYLVACLDFYPMSIPIILSGFDIVGELTYEIGAMGDRDVVDC